VKRRELKTRIKKLQRERKNLCIQYKDPKNIKITISDLDYKIESLKSQLDFQNRLLTHKILSYTLIIVISSLLIWILL